MTATSAAKKTSRAAQQPQPSSISATMLAFLAAVDRGRVTYHRRPPNSILSDQVVWSEPARGQRPNKTVTAQYKRAFDAGLVRLAGDGRVLRYTLDRVVELTPKGRKVMLANTPAAGDTVSATIVDEAASS